ncbi:hypothetical protein MMC21_001053 [Puttea exsequens]|nr:hypothetical protein [Puttea exsequens]
MADVRSLLRNERAQRKISHPQAAYSATGTLECTVCHIPLKSDQDVWNKHLRTTQHAMRAERLRLSSSRPIEPESTRQVSTGTKKRKASNEDESRKKPRPVVQARGPFVDERFETNDVGSLPQEQSPKPLETFTPNTTTLPSHPTPTPKPPTPVQTPSSTPHVNEDEWAAFERDVATPPPSIPALNAYTSATITAAPLTAAEIAAQARDEANVQSKERREAEVEGEREDAVRALEEEFEEMEGLEERVRRLREMREALRVRRAQGNDTDRMLEEVADADSGQNESEGDSDDDDEVDPSWGGWKR